MSISAPLIAALAALALTQPASKKTPSVDEVRATARSLLQSLCGAQCDVIEVTIKQKPVAPAGSVAPGFDEAPAARQVPASIELKLLLDKKLAPALRKFVGERVRHRIGELGLPVTITEEVTPFPELPSPPDETPPPQPQQPAPSPPVIVQAPAPAAPAPAAPAPEAPKPTWDALLVRLIEALPLLLLAALLAFVIFRVLRRLEDLALARLPLAPEEDASAAGDKADKAGAAAATKKQASEIPAPKKEEVAEMLAASRSSSRRVFRSLLLRGELEATARAIAILGDSVVEDLAADPELRQPLEALGRRAAEVLNSPMSEDERDDTLRKLHAELIGDRIAHRADDIRPELEPLLGFSPEAFAALAAGLDDRKRLILLRHAPPSLANSYLAGLSTKERAQAVERLLTRPPADPAELGALAAAVRATHESAVLSGREAERAVDLLDAVGAAEQPALIDALESTRPDFVRRNAGQLPVESALLSLPEHAIERAWGAVPVEDWVAYLRIAPEPIRARAIAACPQRIRDGVIEELRLRVTGDPMRGADARRRIVRAAIKAAPGGGNGATPRAPVVEAGGGSEKR